MALHKHNDLDQESRDRHRYLDKKVIPLSAREAMCLRDYLAETLDNEFQELSFENLQKQLASLLFEYDNYRDIINKGLLFSGSSLISEENFQWLINDLRAQIFTINTLQKIEAAKSESVLNKYGSSIMDSIYSYFDFLSLDGKLLNSNRKVDLLAKAKIIWDAVCEEDNYSEWLKDDNIKQVRKAREYLKKDNRYVDANIDNSNYSEIRSRVLASIDLIDNPIRMTLSKNYKQSDTKVLFLKKMKNAWVQQKQRDEGKTKKPYHLPLTVSTNANLKELAGVNNLTPAKQLEVLINSEHKKVFFDDDGKRKYYT
ncbi:hypothetical protein [Psychrobacter sp. SZ93C1]|uniref:hypothetical protein n=1 Tax=Psychrobacter sp. SZ93C1 TaxID=2792058 RepID=UPI0018CF34EA|nr:hypothetical protein [Psychrobacter sp. SZ93C1]MBH0065717.1 hypothetical protein [Psychrobacter sp. SZ93C1]